jgi:hypothetical protein
MLCITPGQWLGPDHNVLQEVPEDLVFRTAKTAFHHAIKHRSLWPLKGQANA